MGHRMAAVLVAGILILGIARTQVSAQNEQVQLRLRLRAGEAIFYSLSRTTQQTLEIGDRQVSGERRIEAREAHRVLEVGEDGSATVEWVWENFRVAVGEPCTCIDPPFVMRVRPDGLVTEMRQGDEKPDVYLVRLPAGPIAIGDSWEFRTSGDASLRYTYTLAAVDRAGDERIATIRYAVSGVSANRKATLRARGEIQWSVDRGRLLRSSEDATVDTVMDAVTPSGTLRIRQTIRGTERREPFVEPAAAPATVPEKLIVPGKSIGNAALSMTLEELSARYGVAERSQTEGLRAASLTWFDPQAPRGYVDAGDPPKLVGLHTADPAYQTDKGISFGSSEGAVLFAHGMTPVKVEMSIPGLGGVRMLVYDDQGIAFAIASDKEHAGRSGRHAPIGAVDWIIVFSPGDAGKIVPLP